MEPQYPDHYHHRAVKPLPSPPYPIPSSSPSSSSSSSYMEPHPSNIQTGYVYPSHPPSSSSTENTGISSQMGVDTYSQQYLGSAQKQTEVNQGSHPYSINRVKWDPRTTGGLPYGQHPSTIRGEDSAGRMGEGTNLDILDTVYFENGIFYVDDFSV